MFRGVHLVREADVTLLQSPHRAMEALAAHLLRAGAERRDAERGLVAHARGTIGVRAAIPEALFGAGIRERKAGGGPDAIRAADLVAVAAEVDGRLRKTFVTPVEVRVAPETRVGIAGRVRDRVALDAGVDLDREAGSAARWR